MSLPTSRPTPTRQPRLRGPYIHYPPGVGVRDAAPDEVLGPLNVAECATGALVGRRRQPDERGSARAVAAGVAARESGAESQTEKRVNG